MERTSSYIPIVVVYEKRANSTKYLEVFNKHRIEQILDTKKRKPLIPDSYNIIHVGMGEGFIEKFKSKYKIKKHKVWH